MFVVWCEVGTFVFQIVLFLLLRFLPCTPPFILSMLADCGRSDAERACSLNNVARCAELISSFVVSNFFAGFALFPILAISAITSNIFVITLASLINNCSQRVLHNKGHQTVALQNRKSGLRRRELRACCHLKIKFGSNYIDNGTPLLDLWICLLICLTIVVSCLTLYTRYYDSVTGPSDGIRWVSPWLNVLSILFEEPASVPAILEKRAFYRLVFGIWSLMAVFKTNCYNGIMITNLNAPLPGTKVEEWNDIVCERIAGGVNLSHKEITAWVEKTAISKYWGNAVVVDNQVYDTIKLTNPFESENCFRLLSPILPRPFFLKRSTLPANRFFHFEYYKYWDLDRYLRNHYLNGDIRNPEFQLLNPKHGRELPDLSERNVTKSTEELNEMLTREILKCGKTVWIADSDEPEMSGLNFYNDGESKIPQYFQGIIDAGIWSRLEQEKWSKYLSRRVKSRVDTNKVSPVRLNESILTLFVLCGFLIVLALVCIGCESYSTIWFFITTIVKRIRWNVRNMFNLLVKGNYNVGKICN
ncbi:hypothetical protein Fcan01_28491 [Folsomia candida]|uniref:Uncharacterized protein n=1 Tax=Folsomia candida TaxID=158441 RepID=A0A226CXH1_FOLCA|nr:hypothetical protein Fcan01_28491 [Folsomia candida]